MPTPKLLNYYLLTKSGGVTLYYTLDATRTVITTTTKTALKASPMNWASTSLSISRDAKYFGLLRNYAIPAEFLLDAAKIIDHIYVTKGFNADCELLIEIRNDFDYLYSTYWEGKIDFSQIKSDHIKVMAGIKDLGFASTLQAKESTIYEIDFDTHPNSETFRHDGIDLQAKYQYFVSETLDASGNPTQHTIGFNPNFLDVAAMNDETFLSLGVAGSATHAGTTSSQNTLFTCEYPFAGEVNFNFPVTYENDASSSADIRFRLRLSIYPNGNFGGSPTTNVIVYADTATVSPGNSRSITASGSYSVNFVEGDAVIFMVDIELIGPSATRRYRVTADGDWNITGVFKMPETENKQIRLFDLGAKLISEMSGGTATFVSSFLSTNQIHEQNNPYYTFVTSGAALRGVSSPKIKTTWADFYKSMRSVYGLGMHINGNTVYLEKLSTLFDKATTIYIVPGQVSDYKFSHEASYNFSTIEVGYQDQTYDELNGRQEFNSLTQWSTGITTGNGVLDLVSIYRADPFGIEFVRSRRFVSGSTGKAARFKTASADDGADNDNFMIHCSASLISGKRVAYRTAIGTVSGPTVAANTVYNVTLMPCLNLRRSMDYVVSCIPPNTLVKFQSTKKGTITVNFGPTTIIGNQSILSALYSSLFNCIMHEFEAPAPKSLYTLVANAPFGVIQFTTSRGKTFRGFPIDMSINPAMTKASVYKLLSSPNDNKTDLIRP